MTGEATKKKQQHCDWLRAKRRRCARFLCSCIFSVHFCWVHSLLITVSSTCSHSQQWLTLPECSDRSSQDSEILSKADKCHISCLIMSLSFGITLQVTPSCNLTGNLNCISTVSANIQINVIMNDIQCSSVVFSPHLSSCMHFAHPEEKVKNTLQDVQK